MDLSGTTINTDVWADVLTRLRPEIKRRRSSMQINLIRSKAKLTRIGSRVSLLYDERHSSEPLPFLKLPRKIRHRIYQALFDLMIPTSLVVKDPLSLNFNPESTFPRILPALCYANRQIYLESAPMMLKGRHMVLPDLLAVKVLTDFLSRLSNMPFNNGIRSLVFGRDVNWQPFATHTVQQLLRRCTNLRHIKIGVTPAACVRYDCSGSGDIGGLSLRLRKHVIEQTDLSCLLGCRTLKALTLSCVEGEVYALRMGTRVDVIFAPIVSWVRLNLCGAGGLCLKVEYELWGKLFSVIKNTLGDADVGTCSRWSCFAWRGCFDDNQVLYRLLAIREIISHILRGAESNT